MNSSSLPALAVQPRSASRASCLRRTWRGEATTSLPSCHCRSTRHSAVPSCHGTTVSVSRSGAITKSPYPRDHEDMAYPSTVFISTSTASR